MTTVAAVGFLAGDQVAWTRRWLPAGAAVTTWDGLLPDPAGEFSRFINPSLTTLESSMGVRARVALGDPGIGKSNELRREILRLQAAGHHVELIDLGSYASPSEVKTAVAEAAGAWRAASEPGDLLLAFDGFDEPLIDVRNLSDVLEQSLSLLDMQRLRVIVASRGSQWRPSLQSRFVQWWGQDQVLALELAPLSAGDVAAAAASEGLDCEEFLEAVQTAAAGPLAARPITLRLLLTAAAGDGGLPSTRLDAYRLGVAGLAVESHVRRRERRCTGTDLAKRLVAARRLAAVSVLTGRPAVVRRSGPRSLPGQLALDEVAGGEVTQDALDDVWDSALLSGNSDARTWCHRSVAEFLCGEVLAALPPETAWSLLAAPGDPTLLRPQLEDTAAWAAGLGDTMFERLLVDRPELLLNPDLPGRTATQGARVGRAVLARLSDGQPLLQQRRTATTFDYPGAVDDLRPFLAAGQPHWRRRDAVRLVGGAGLRSLDEELLGLVREAVGLVGYPEPVELAAYAASALAGAVDPAVVTSMRSLLADRNLSLHVRAMLIVNLFPQQLTANDLTELIDPQDRFVQPFGRTIVRAMRTAVTSGSVPAEDLLGWFHPPSDLAGTDDRARQLAATAALATVRVGPVGPHWQAAVGAVRWLLTGQSRLAEWSPEDVDALAPASRRDLCRELLSSHSDDFLANELAERGLLRGEDLLWWLDQLDEQLSGESSCEDDVVPSVSSAIAILTWRVLHDDDALVAARQRCAASPRLTAIAEELSERTVAQRRASQAKGQLRHQQSEAAQAQHLFQPQRLHAALATSNYRAVLDELGRQPTRGGRSAWPDGPTPAWMAIDPQAQQRVAKLAAHRLATDEHDLQTAGEVRDLAATVQIVAAGDRSLLDSVPAERWSRWLPALLRWGVDRAAQTCLSRALAHSLDDVAATLIVLVDEQASGPGYLPTWLLEQTPADLLDQLARRALEYAGSAAVPPDALPGLLAIGKASQPTDSARVALEHLARRGEPPAAAATRQDPTVAPWLRALHASCALIAHPELSHSFEPLLAAFRTHPQLAVEAVRSLDPSQAQQAWRALSAEQLAQLYLWANTTMPTRRLAPGVVVGTDRAEDLPGDLLGALIARRDHDAVVALQHLATSTDSVYLRASAKQLAAEVATDDAAPPSVKAVLAVLDDPARRTVTSTAQLARLVLEELDAFAEDLQRDRARRSRLWERQRKLTKWAGTWVPAEETRLSDELAAELRERLRGRIAVVREVEVQPRLATVGADRPDLLTITTDTGVALTLPIEVKGNHNPDVIESLQSQLADRYLAGPVGAEGVYVVGYFHGDDWARTDSRRLRLARRHTLPDLRAALHLEVSAAASNGKIVHVRVIDIPLGLQDDEVDTD